MPIDLESIADPRFIVLAWASGLAFATAWIFGSGIVGKGYLRMATAVTVIVGVAGAFMEAAWMARLGLVVLVVSVLVPTLRLAGILQGAAGLLFLIQASQIAGPLLSVTGALALGGVTAEMVLGHWYLVDPRLPRRSLRILALVGIGGLTVDALSIWTIGISSGGAAIAFLVLAATSILLMLGVLGSLKQPEYSGVMAATGLSYLAVLTTLGMVFLGRALAAGVGPLL